MTDNQEFKPYTPEKKVDVTIFKREAVLLYKLRKISYGKIVIHKANGMLVRIEPMSSELIEEDTNIEL